MENAVPKPRKAPKARAVTTETAREKILSKLQTAGPKGASSLYPKSSAHAAIFEEALASLQDEQRPEVFVDRRGKALKYFLWAYRPKLPTAAEVAAKLLAFALRSHPRVYDAAALGKMSGLAKDELALVADALLQLCETGELVAVEFATSAKAKLRKLYLAREALPQRQADASAAREADPTPTSAPSPDREPAPEQPDLSPDYIRRAYEALVRQTGFRAVPIASLQKAAAVAMDELKALLREEHAAGRVVLSVGDWSIAGHEERLGVIELHGERYLQVRWL